MSYPYADPVPLTPVVFPPPPKTPPSPSRPAADGEARLAKKATVFPTVLSETAPSIGAAATAAPTPAAAADTGDVGGAAVAVACDNAGDGLIVFTCLPPLLDFGVQGQGPEPLVPLVPPPPPPPPTLLPAAALASPTVIALTILTFRFVHGRFS